MASRMFVIKRNGEKEPAKFDKITSRIEKLCEGLNPDYIDPCAIAQKVVEGMRSGITTSGLDTLAAETAASQATVHPDFNTLAARISISNLQKTTTEKFSENISRFFHHVHPKTGTAAPLVSEHIHTLVMSNPSLYDDAIDYSRDFEFDYFGLRTLERGYLTKLDGVVVERPQQMIMRVALGIHGENTERVMETYDLMSRKFFIHATPTLFNAGTPRPQMSSCFLLTMKEDSIEGIYDSLKACAMISKYAGGIGLSIHSIRASESYIRGTNGSSNGIVPMLRVFSDTARYVDQGGGKRKGSFAIYLEPWHADIFEFLDLKKNHGKEEARARDLFYALWVPDLFMKRVKENGDWSLFCPNEAPGLHDTYGTEFEALFEKYEREGRARKTIRAQELWAAILEAQIETGVPYMLYKDSVNNKSNQKNLGTIKSSNLCCEIVEYTAPDEIAVCNLASLNLSKFVAKNADGAVFYDLDELVRVAKVVTRNLNNVIDLNFYPLPEARKSNMRHRPVGLGVQGLADAFMMMGYAFESEEAMQLNKDIFEAIYFGAVTSSMELAREVGPYETYEGSPASKGELQFDMWGVSPSDRWDWTQLKADIATHGLRNSLLVAPMPTASTSQILGNNECFEPYTSNLYVRRTLAGEFCVVNKHMLRDLVTRGLWTDDVRLQVMADKGSIQNIASIPQDVKELYKTVWEIKQKRILEMAAARGPFIDQSQSLNVFIADPTVKKLTSMHFYGWKSGLKTGMYYLRTRPKADAIAFTVDQHKLAASRTAGAAAAAAATATAAASTTAPAGEAEAGTDEVQVAPIGAASLGAATGTISPYVIDTTGECTTCSA